MRGVRGGAVKDKTHKLYFTPEDGVPTWEHEGQFERVVRSLKQGIKHELTIKPHRSNRSAEQNSYMWAVVYKIMSDETGYTPEEIHQLMGERFLSYEKDGRTFIKSTTKLKTVEMEEYLSQVRMFASTELSCYIPLPNEAKWTES